MPETCAAWAFVKQDQVSGKSANLTIVREAPSP